MVKKKYLMIKGTYPAIAVSAYVILALLCLEAPSLLPVNTILGTTLMGPPVLLVWGWQIWPIFASFTAVLAALFVLAIRLPSTRIAIAFISGIVWLVVGFLSAALSI